MDSYESEPINYELEQVPSGRTARIWVSTANRRTNDGHRRASTGIFIGGGANRVYSNLDLPVNLSLDAGWSAINPNLVVIGSQRETRGDFTIN